MSFPQTCPCLTTLFMVPSPGPVSLSWDFCSGSLSLLKILSFFSNPLNGSTPRAGSSLSCSVLWPQGLEKRLDLTLHACVRMSALGHWGKSWAGLLTDSSHSSHGSLLWDVDLVFPTYSSVLAWRIPGTGEPGGLPSMGSHRVGDNWSDLAAAAAGFPGGASGKELACQCRRFKRCEFDPWVGKIPLEEGLATHSSILAWRIPWTEEPWWATVHRVIQSQIWLKWLSMYVCTTKAQKGWVTCSRAPSW